MAVTIDESTIAARGVDAATAPRVDAPPRWPVVAILSVVTALVVVALLIGHRLIADHVALKLQTPPLRGRIDWQLGWNAVPAIAVALLGVGALPWAARRMRWSTLLFVAFGGALVWAVALASIDGRDALTAPLLPKLQYLYMAQHVRDPAEFLRTFVERLPSYNVHTQGHPPGMVMLLWAMDRVGLGGVAWNATLVLVGGAAGVVATLVGVRDVAGERLARAALPLLVLAPAMIWWSSADALYMGVGATAITLLLLAIGRAGRASDRLAVGAGLAFACTAFLSYGLVLLAMIPIAVALSRHRFRPLVIAGVVSLACALAVAAGTGFAWWEGLQATRVRYYAGVARNRPYEYFLLGDLAVFALMVGPAGLAGLTRVRRTPLAVLMAGAVTVVVLADLSGMSKAEVERIWLPFVPWVLVAGAVLVDTRRWATRGWLTAQALVTLAVAVTVRSPW